MRLLLPKDVQWPQGQVKDEAFTHLKTEIASTTTLWFFDPKEPVGISVQKK